MNEYSKCMNKINESRGERKEGGKKKKKRERMKGRKELTKKEIHLLQSLRNKVGGIFSVNRSRKYTNPKSLHTWDMWAVSLAVQAPHFRLESGGCGGEGGTTRETFEPLTS